MRREATIYAGRPISAPAVAKPQHDGSWRAPTNAPVCRSDSNHMRRRGAKSFVDDLVLSRGVVLSRADLFCDLLRLSPMTRRFVRFRRTYLRRRTGGAGTEQHVASRASGSRAALRFVALYRSACRTARPIAVCCSAICYMRQLACRTARGVCLGRARARCQTAALFFVAYRCQRVAAAKNDKFCLACRTARGMHAGRPVSLACRTARDAGSL